jgi:hypothetical protein
MAHRNTNRIYTWHECQRASTPAQRALCVIIDAIALNVLGRGDGGAA